MSVSCPGPCRSAPGVDDGGWPVGDQRRRDAALVNPVLVFPERRVRQVCPGDAVALVGVLGPRHDRGIVAPHHGSAIAGEPSCPQRRWMGAVGPAARTPRRTPRCRPGIESACWRSGWFLPGRQRWARCPGPSGRSAPRTLPCGVAPTPCAVPRPTAVASDPDR